MKHYNINFDKLLKAEGIEFGLFDKSTQDAAREIVSHVYRPKTCVLLDMMLKNPLMDEYGDVDCGDIVYANGKPVAFQAAIRRTVYWQQERYGAIVGSTLCKDKDATPVLLPPLMKKTGDQHRKHIISFGNTSARSVAQIQDNKAQLFVLKTFFGPSTYDYTFSGSISVINRLRFFFVHLVQYIVKKLSFGNYTCEIHGKLAHIKDVIPLFAGEVRRVSEIEYSRFDDFWSRYVANNKGLVSSRTAKEVDWVFGDGLRSGAVVMLAHYYEDCMDGWIVLQPNRSSLDTWHVLDWIAIGNSDDILGDLLKGAKEYLRVNAKACRLELWGFPQEIQPLVRKHLPDARPRHGDVFSYCPKDLEFAKKVEVIKYPDSWFFGVYDGDATYQWRCESADYMNWS